VVPEINDSSVRELFVFNYRLMYRVGESLVEIIAFVHGARDFQQKPGGGD
jgi:toxin ParE1/3/4